MTSRDDDGAAAPESERAGMAGTGNAPPPEMPDAYEEALGRLLDGLAPGSGADLEGGAADERAGADVALIRRGLGLIAAELAGGTTAAAASAEEPTSDGPAVADPPPAVLPLTPARPRPGRTSPGRTRPVGPRRAGDARVVPLPRPSAITPEPVPGAPPVRGARWRRPVPAVLAVAASLTLVLTLGTSLLDGPDDRGDSTAQQAPAAGASAPEGGPDAALDSPGRSAATAAEAAEAAGAAAAPAAAAPAADAAAPAADAAAAAPAAASAKAAKAGKAADPFARTVACARAIVIGEIVGVGDVAGSGRAKVTFEITEYLKGEGATTRTFVVGSRSARFGEATGPLAAGQRGLFLVPQGKDSNVRAWLDDDVPTGRKKLLAAMESRAGC